MTHCMASQLVWRGTSCRMRLITTKLRGFLFMFSTGYTSFSILLLFLPSHSSSLFTVSDAISSNIDEDPSINPSANVIVFENFSVYHKGWISYSGGTNWPGKIVFLSQTTLLRWLVFLLRSLTMTLTSICSTLALSPLGNSDQVVVKVSSGFP